MNTNSTNNQIHRILFMTTKAAHTGVEQWFIKAKLSITPLQFGIMRNIPKDGITLNDLARSMMFKPPSLLPSVDLLESRHYITRRADPHDRRKTLIEITARGKRIVDKVIASRRPDPLSLSFQKMSASKKKQLITLLKTLHEGMQL